MSKYRTRVSGLGIQWHYMLLLQFGVIFAVAQRGLYADEDILGELRSGLNSAKQQFLNTPVFASYKIVATDKAIGNSQPTVTQNTYEFGLKGTSHFLIRGIKGPLESVKARNPNYAFYISRSAALPNNPFSVAYLTATNSDEKSKMIIASEELEAYSVIMTPYRYSGHFTWDFINSDDIEITSLELKEDRDSRLVQLDFRAKEDTKLITHWLTVGGTLVFDAKNSWALTESKRLDTSTPPALSTLTINSVKVGDGLMITKDYVVRYFDVKEHEMFHGRTELVTNNAISEQEFMLSHYGLPEPNFDQQWFGPWVWYFLAGISFIGVAYYLKRRNG